MNSITHRGVLWAKECDSLVTVSEDVGPGNPPFSVLSKTSGCILPLLQQTITHLTEDFKLLLSGEVVGTIAGTDDLGDVLLKHGWLVAYVNIINPTG